MRRGPFEGAWALALLLGAALVGAGCGDSSPSAAAVDYAGAYATVIRHVASGAAVGDTAALPAVVFVEPLPGTKLSLPDQAKILKALDDSTEVRFIDDRAEAIDKAQPGAPVRRHGVLVGLGAAEPDAEDAQVKAVRYRMIDDEATLCVRVHFAGDAWQTVAADRC
jgi:hypothetical protein